MAQWTTTCHAPVGTDTRGLLFEPSSVPLQWLQTVGARCLTCFRMFALRESSTGTYLGTHLGQCWLSAGFGLRRFRYRLTIYFNGHRIPCGFNTAGAGLMTHSVCP